MNDLVSVIIPTYNREKYILRAIQSVLNQSYDKIEVIVVDDHSTDNTIKKIQNKYSNDNRVKLHILEQNFGACAARNIGIRLSMGTYIAFLDSDDVYSPTKIEKQIALLKTTDTSICISDFTYISTSYEEIYKSIPHGSKDDIYNDLLYCNFITTGTILGYRYCFEQILYDETLSRYQDWDLAIRLYQKYKFCFLRESTLIQYSQPISISANTTHTKTLNALETIYSKNAKSYINNKKAFTQLHWLMGLHSIFIPNKKYIHKLWIGITYDGFNFKRFIVLIAAIIKLNKFIERMMK